VAVACEVLEEDHVAYSEIVLATVAQANDCRTLEDHGPTWVGSAMETVGVVDDARRGAADSRTPKVQTFGLLQFLEFGPAIEVQLLQMALSIVPAITPVNAQVVPLNVCYRWPLMFAGP
jgi:hypothetical protein